VVFLAANVDHYIYLNLVKKRREVQGVEGRNRKLRDGGRIRELGREMREE